MRLRLTVLELAITSGVVGIIGLCVLIVPSSLSTSISAALAIIALALAATAYRLSDENTGARTAAKAGGVIGVVVLADIWFGLGTMW